MHFAPIAPQPGLRPGRWLISTRAPDCEPAAGSSCHTRGNSALPGAFPRTARPGEGTYPLRYFVSSFANRASALFSWPLSSAHGGPRLSPGPESSTKTGGRRRYARDPRGIVRSAPDPSFATPRSLARSAAPSPAFRLRRKEAFTAEGLATGLAPTEAATPQGRFVSPSSERSGESEPSPEFSAARPVCRGRPFGGAGDGLCPVLPGGRDGPQHAPRDGRSSVQTTAPLREPLAVSCGDE